MSERDERSGIEVRVLAGLHEGGSIELAEGSTTVVGSGTRADFLLGDARVRERHCALVVARGRVTAEALEAAIEVDGLRVEAGGRAPLRPGSALVIGGAAMRLHIDDLPAPGQAAPVPRTTPRRARAARRVARAGLASLVVLALATAVSLPWLAGEPGAAERAAVPAPPPTTDDEQARAAARAEKAERETDGKARGAMIAASVRDVLRLSGVAARAEYVGDGKVRVIGPFGDGKAVAEAIRSRAMAAVAGLEQVVAVNTDEPAAGEGGPRPPSRNPVARVVGGPDPYLVLEDGSLVYPGAALPSGGTLADIEDGRAIILRDGSDHKVEIVGRTLTELDPERGET